MKRYKFVAFSQAVQGMEAEYLAWIDHHVTDVLKTPDYRSAQRFRAIGPTQGNLPANLVIYEIETNDIDATLALLNSRGRSGNLSFSSSLDAAGLVFGVFDEQTAPMLSPDAATRIGKAAT
ncbi:MAG: hypothetical protein K0U79_13345 [Gammaproteobacteria bacterium]|nr:hypothetical protein [Gammaproteobacteria bacterium]